MSVDKTEHRTKNDLRCFCSRKPLLAIYGVDASGKIYVHVRVYKQHRLYGEILCRDGSVEILCRECIRWHKVKIIQPNQAVLEESTQPEEVSPPFFFTQENADANCS